MELRDLAELVSLAVALSQIVWIDSLLLEVKNTFQILWSTGIIKTVTVVAAYVDEVRLQ